MRALNLGSLYGTIHEMARTRPDTALPALEEIRVPDPESAGGRLGEAVVRDRVRGLLFGEESAPTELRRFALLYRLGVGATRAVYAAYDETLDRKVAITILDHRNTAADASLLEEARTLARAVHPNVAAVLAVGDDPDGIYLATEFVRGVNLAVWLQQPRSWEACLDLFIPAGRGLAAAHALGVTHRNFKPANVIVSDDNRVRVIDFGLARAALASPGTLGGAAADAVADQTASVVGTPAYMAHECWSGQRIDERSDQFAFCVSVFEAVYGCRPFLGATLQQHAGAVKNETIQIPPHADRVPKWLHEALLRGLRRDRDARWPSMPALLDELTRRRQSSNKRWPSVAAAMGVGVAATLRAFALGSSGAKEDRGEGEERAE